MRKAGLGLALVASAQLTLLSSPAFADTPAASDAPPAAAASTPSTAAAGASSASASGTVTTTPEVKADTKDTGWILLGAGGALTIGGIIVDIVGANSGTVAGMGGPGDSGQTDNTRSTLYFVGTTLIVAGVVAGIYGGSLLWGNGQASGAQTTDRPAPADDARNDVVSKTVQAKLQSAPSFMLPVVHASF